MSLGLVYLLHPTSLLRAAAAMNLMDDQIPTRLEDSKDNHSNELKKGENI